MQAGSIAKLIMTMITTVWGFFSPPLVKPFHKDTGQTVSQYKQIPHNRHQYGIIAQIKLQYGKPE